MGKGASVENYWQWQYDSSAAYFAKFQDLLEQIPGKRVFDIGCGLGGRTCYLAGKKPAVIVGADINHEEIRKAKDICARRLDKEDVERIKFVEVSEDSSKNQGDYDVVLLIDSLEHVKDPVGMLDLAWSCTKPGGVCYFSTVGWYHHNASHVGSIVPIPFVTLFFSDRQILDAVRGIVGSSFYQPAMWDSDPPLKRWEGITDLGDRPGEYLNKITIKGIRQAVKASKFGGGEITVEGFSWKQLPVMRVFNFLARVPVVQEVYHSAVFGRLKKN